MLALQRLLPRIPVALRAPTARLQKQLLDCERTLLVPREIVCLVEIPVMRAGRDYGSNSSCGIAPAQIAQGDSFSSENGVWIGIVPDGVATATLHFAAHGGHPAVTAAGAAIGNLVSVILRGQPGLRGGFIEPSIVLRSSSGRVIRSIPAGGSVSHGGSTAVSSSSSSAAAPDKRGR